MSEREVDMYRLDASPRVRQNMDDGFGMGERMLKREYVGDAEEDGCSIRSMHTVEDGRTVRSVHPVEDGRSVRNVHPVEDGLSVRSMHPVGQNCSRRIRIIEEEDDEWTMGDDESEWIDDNRMDLVQFPSKRLRYERTLHRTKPHVSERISSRGASGYVEVGMHENRLRFGRDFSMRRRIRSGPVNYPNSFNFVRRRDFYKPHKYWKKNFEGHHGGVHEEAPLEGDAPPAKVDLPEDSEELKQQVEKAFLRFTKLLNETPHQRRRYQEQGKADKLLCSVCGRSVLFYICFLVLDFIKLLESTF
ncbi:hypothetical protein QJS10_CPA08g01556 [Acorus calamus]|uniref:Uncharacterized protein n=1 Tax=Acorus calamus TaxID=4465 RepID=A0AAV9EDH3_ACOCL|nr:hypothetical protein QJS10_CPA08g01556 [Acorus calamus]